jgi:hypothetical protein
MAEDVPQVQSHLCKTWRRTSSPILLEHTLRDDVEGEYKEEVQYKASLLGLLGTYKDPRFTLTFGCSNFIRLVGQDASCVHVSGVPYTQRILMVRSGMNDQLV